MSDTEDQQQPSVPPTRVVESILYCPICTAPCEYCEFGPSSKRCKAWLTEKHPDLVATYWKGSAPAAGASGLEDKVDTLKVSDGNAAGEGSSSSSSSSSSSTDQQPKQSEKLDALQKEELKKEKKQKEARVVIKRIERTKRKCVITVAGLDVFDVELKKAAKLFATKFATGASVTKNPAGFDEIVVQGDVQDEIFDLIRSTWKNIPKTQIDCD